ncbi:sorbitol dehydrogenase family protein, partial [Pseudomonas sp. ES3-33]|uniref:sorbitol dehydrogenase family protein n=1 Tax=Pseudomonas sp. ES3-33 TaxID=1628833 RepID=UPI000A5C7684
IYDRDDSPMNYRLSRRKVVMGGVLTLSSIAFSLSTPWNVWAAETLKESPFSERFMSLSRLLINHRLDPQVGLRLASAMQAMNAGWPALVDGLIAIAGSKQAKVVEDFFPDIPEGSLKQGALEIISAWYKGVLVDSPNAEVFAYEHALMYQPTIDVMTIPSYAISGPNGWSAEAPPLAEMPKF